MVHIDAKAIFSSGDKLENNKIGANTHVLNQINALEVERDILTKTISRLYDNDSDLTKIQHDRLLLRYQHQLGVIIARICLLYTSPSPRDYAASRMPSSA